MDKQLTQDEIKKYKMIYFASIDEWKAKGKELFGDNKLEWKFICPSCGIIQTANEIKKANPSLTDERAFNFALFGCIGRALGSENSIWSKKQPCNYTSGGLFNLNKTIVLCKEENGTELEQVRIFSFYDVNKIDKVEEVKENKNVKKIKKANKN